LKDFEKGDKSPYFFLDFLTLGDGTEGCSETSVRNYHSYAA